MKYSIVTANYLYKFDDVDYYGLALNDALNKHIFNIMLKGKKWLNHTTN